MSNNAFKQFYNFVDSSKKILILNSKPDGDSIGASLALQKILWKLNKDVISNSFYQIPEYLRLLTNKGKIEVIESLDLPHSYDLVVIVDSSNLSRCTNKAEIDWMKGARFVSLDHHDFDSGEWHADLEILDNESESTCGLITDLAEFYRKEEEIDLLDEDIAFLLYSGIVSDTDYFGYSNVRRETFERGAVLMRYEFDSNPIILQFRESLSLKAFKFIQRNLSKVYVNEEKKYAYLKIKKEDYKDEDNLAVVNEASNYLNRAMMRIIDSVDFSFIIKENAEGKTSLALRRHNNGNKIDLSLIASKFGGGGHKQAAGAVVQKNVDEFEKEIIDHLERGLG